ncbi:glycosyltransferase family 2 protein [Pontibacter ruber]|uniref:Glycosyltransferase family 2 protein n=1 Tax=Pontibacter ruber TaxID=1343895 RepID=A0ABW5D340_9BACT|nr:glycosyltransferase family A protein [Pontibacter ruber]
MNSKKPMFSVVIPLYNKEAHVAETINSALSQTYRDFELIVVDDGSTDKSLQIALSITDPRLKVFSKKNGGVSDARNHGIKKSNHQYIALLDADDNWEPGFLAEMKRLIDKYPFCGLYAAAYKKINPVTSTINPVTSTIYGNEVQEGIVDDFFKVKLKHHVPWSSAIVINKSVFDNVGGFPVGMIGGEDDYTWAKIATKYNIAFTPKVLAVYKDTCVSHNARLGRIDSCKESWFDLYQEGDFYRNEFIARKAIYAGIRYAYSPSRDKSNEIEKQTEFTVLSKKLWWDLYILNRVPYQGLVMWKTMSPRYRKVKHWVKQLIK